MSGWRRAELKAGVYDEIVSARLDRQLAALGTQFEVSSGRAHGERTDRRGDRIPRSGMGSRLRWRS